VENYDVKKLCEDVRIEATNLAEHHFNWSPEVVITTNKTSDQIQLWMIPYFGRFILLEVLKNALYATALKFMDDNNIVKSSLVDPDIVSSAPPVRLSITSSTEGVRVCVADSGGGMSDETVRNATKFLWASTLQAR
jgi:signal transduction histidine kinase